MSRDDFQNEYADLTLQYGRACMRHGQASPQAKYYRRLRMAFLRYQECVDDSISAFLAPMQPAALEIDY